MIFVPLEVTALKQSSGPSNYAFISNVRSPFRIIFFATYAPSDGSERSIDKVSTSL